MWVAVSMAVISLIGVGVSATAQVSAADAANDAAKYNAEMQKRAANDALTRGAADAAAVKERSRRMIASQVAAQSAEGFDSSTGTALELSTETAGFGELDALKTINNAQRKASGMNAQADLDLFQGRSAQSAGYLNATGTVFSGIGSTAGSFFGSAGGKSLLAGKNGSQ